MAQTTDSQSGLRIFSREAAERLDLDCSKSGLFGLTKTLAREAAFLLARSGKLSDPEGIGLTVNTVTPRVHRHRDAHAHPRQGDGEDHRPDPAGPARQAGGGRARRALPGRGRLVLHHRTGLGRQRQHDG